MWYKEFIRVLYFNFSISRLCRFIPLTISFAMLFIFFFRLCYLSFFSSDLVLLFFLFYLFSLEFLCYFFVLFSFQYYLYFISFIPFFKLFCVLVIYFPFTVPYTKRKKSLPASKILSFKRRKISRSVAKELLESAILTFFFFFLLK